MRRELQQATGHQVAVNIEGGDALQGQVDHVTRAVVALVDVHVIDAAQTEIPGTVLVPLIRVLWVQVT